MNGAAIPLWLTIVYWLALIWSTVSFCYGVFGPNEMSIQSTAHTLAHRIFCFIAEGATISALIALHSGWGVRP